MCTAKLPVEYADEAQKRCTQKSVPVRWFDWIKSTPTGDPKQPISTRRRQRRRRIPCSAFRDNVDLGSWLSKVFGGKFHSILSATGSPAAESSHGHVDIDYIDPKGTIQLLSTKKKSSLLPSFVPMRFARACSSSDPCATLVGAEELLLRTESRRCPRQWRQFRWTKVFPTICAVDAWFGSDPAAYWRSRMERGPSVD